MKTIKHPWQALLVIMSLAGLLGCQALGSKQTQQQGGVLTPSPTSISFGNVQIGTSQSLSGTLTNTGGGSITVTEAAVTGAGYSISGLTLPLTLAAGQGASYSVLFSPTSAGSASGNIAFTNDNGILNVPLSGTGVAVGALSTTPSSISFGNVVVGGNSSQTETLKNIGGTDLTVTAATVSGAGFSYTGLTLPLTLAPNQASTFGVKFAPTGTGTSSGVLSLTVSGSASTVDVALSGMGVTPGTLTPSPTSVAFGNVQVGTSVSATETLTNTGGSSLTISAAAASGSGVSLSGLTLPLTLNAGQSTSFTVHFAPTASGSVNGNLSVTSNGSNPSLSIPVSGAGVSQGTLSANPTSLAFGSVQVGKSSTLSETLSNTGGTALTISAASASGTGFSLGGLTLPLTLNPGQNTTFSVTFSPSASGSATGSVSITSNGSNPNLSIALSGTGVTQGALTANPSSLNFGNVQDGSSESLTDTLTNTGGTSLTISAASASGAGFSLSGLTLPLTLGAGQSTSFTVLFSPTASGSVSGNVSVTSNGSDSNLSIPLTGTGVAQGALGANPTSLAFGSVQIGKSSILSEMLTNTGGSSLTISAATASGSGYSLSGLTLPLTLSAGQSTSFTVTFSPAASGSVSGNVAITSDGSNPNLNIPLSGTGVTQGTLSANPSSLGFGNVQVGNSTNLSETLTNIGGSSVTITQANVTGAMFSISGLTLPTTLTPNQSVTFTATFTPSSAGGASGSLSIVSNASNSPLSIALSGTGTAAGTLTVSPTSLGFGSVVVGTSSALTANLNASGAAVTVQSTIPTNTEFVLSGISLPITIPAGQSATFTVTFTPQATGATSASLSFPSNASNSPTVQSLTGTGSPQPVHTVALSWNASPTGGITSYNVYRSTFSSNSCGSYSTIGSTSSLVLTYTDNAVTDGTTYCYVTTAVDPEGESSYSNVVQAAIPAP